MPAEDQTTTSDPPRLLGFYHDLWDDDGTAIGWRPVAWGLCLADGSAISVSVAGPTAVTIWHRVEDACVALDASVAPVEPRRSLRKELGTPDPGQAIGSSPAGPSGGGEVE